MKQVHATEIEKLKQKIQQLQKQSQSQSQSQARTQVQPRSHPHLPQSCIAFTTMSWNMEDERDKEVHLATYQHVISKQPLTRRGVRNKVKQHITLCNNHITSCHTMKYHIISFTSHAYDMRHDIPSQRTHADHFPHFSVG